MQLCCICLLLFTQQIALTHTLWHAAGGHALPPAHDSSTDDHPHEHEHEGGAQGALCAWHLAVGTLLGGHHGGVATLPPAASACGHALLTYAGRLGAEPVPAVSRGPPPLL